jgi:hypothetical protein
MMMYDVIPPAKTPGLKLLLDAAKKQGIDLLVPARYTHGIMLRQDVVVSAGSRDTQGRV